MNIENSLYPFKINKKYGFIDNMGNVIIEPKYNYAEGFIDGLAIIAIKDFLIIVCHIIK